MNTNKIERRAWWTRGYYSVYGIYFVMTRDGFSSLCCCYFENKIKCKSLFNTHTFFVCFVLSSSFFIHKNGTLSECFFCKTWKNVCCTVYIMYVFHVESSKIPYIHFFLLYVKVFAFNFLTVSFWSENKVKFFIFLYKKKCIWILYTYVTYWFEVFS